MDTLEQVGHCFSASGFWSVEFRSFDAGHTLTADVLNQAVRWMRQRIRHKNASEPQTMPTEDSN